MSNKPSILKKGSGSKRRQSTRGKHRAQPPPVVREKKKPQWDSTVSDLNMHRLTNEQVERRHQIHQSRNMDAARNDLYEQPRDVSTSLNTSGNMRPPSILYSHRRKIAPVRKVSAPSRENLQDVLEQSDKTLADVRDLFGDEPKRYTGNPLVTVAPHVITNKTCLERAQQESIVDSGMLPTAEGSPGGIRHSSVLELKIRKPALNELPSPPPKFNLDDDADHTHSSYQPLINLSRFHQYLTHEDPPTITHHTTLTSPPKQQAARLNPHTNGRSSLSSNNTSSSSNPLDDTLTSNGHRVGGVSRPRPLYTNSMSQSQVENSHQRRENERDEGNEISWMSSVVTELEEQVEEYERGLSVDSISHTPPHQTATAFTGMTSSLLQSITKLTHYLNQARKELAEERILREELLQAMGEQQNLMDNLTRDVVRLCEENSSIKQELSRVHSSTTQQVEQLQSQVGSLSQQLNTLLVTPSSTTVKGSVVSPIVSTSHTRHRPPATPPQLQPHLYKPMEALPSSSRPYSSSPVTSSSSLLTHGAYTSLPTVTEGSETEAAINYTIPTSTRHLSHTHTSQPSSIPQWSMPLLLSTGAVSSSFPSIPPAPPPLSEALQTPHLPARHTSPPPASHYLPPSSHTLKWTPPSSETSSTLAPTSRWAPTLSSFSTTQPHVTHSSLTPQPSSSLPAFTSIAQSILAELAAPLQHSTVTSPTTSINDSALSTATS